MKALTNILKEYLYSSKIYIDDEDFTLHLYSNPNFPTVKAISDTFDYFSISNIVADVPKDAFTQLPKSFLAVISNQDSEEVALITRNKSSVRINGQAEYKIVSYNDFLNIWNGTIIVAEGNISDKANITSIGKIFFIALSLLLIIIQFFLFDLYMTLLSGLTLVGVLLSILIVKEEIGSNNSIVKKVCNSVNNNGGCGKIISSSDGKLFGFISLSSAAAAYFISELFLLTLTGINVTFLFTISVLGLPVIVYSLYSQAFRLKQWCVLCLGISTLFFINLMISGYMFSANTVYYDPLYHFRALFLMSVVYISIDYARKFLKENKNLKNERMEFYTLKKDLNIFKAILANSRTIDTTVLPNSLKISFGSETPALEIDAFTNPTCGYCSDSFKVYYKLLKSDSQRIRVNLIFNVPFENQQNISTKIAAKAIKLYSEGNKYESLEMLNKWFSDRNSQQWLKLYDKPEPISMAINQTLEAHRNWGSSNGINYTPATIINGQVFPDNYKIDDLYLLAGDLVIEEEKKTLVMEDI